MLTLDNLLTHYTVMGREYSKFSIDYSNCVVETNINFS